MLDFEIKLQDGSSLHRHARCIEDAVADFFLWDGSALIPDWRKEEGYVFG